MYGTTANCLVESQYIYTYDSPRAHNDNNIQAVHLAKEKNHTFLSHKSDYY